MDWSGIFAAPTYADFQRELREMVTADPPRVFALCEEIGEREDGHVRYWGLAFDDCAELVAAVGNFRARFKSVESAVGHLSRRRKLHLIWADPMAR